MSPILRGITSQGQACSTLQGITLGSLSRYYEGILREGFPKPA